MCVHKRFTYTTYNDIKLSELKYIQNFTGNFPRDFDGFRFFFF